MLSKVYPFIKKRENAIIQKEDKSDELNIIDMMKKSKDENDYMAIFHFLHDNHYQQHDNNNPINIIDETWVTFILKVSEYIINEWDDINPTIDQLYEELYYFSKKIKNEQQQQEEKEEICTLWIIIIRSIIYHCRSTIYCYQKNWMYTILYCKKTISLLSSSSSLNLSPFLSQKLISLHLHTIMLLTTSLKQHHRINKFKPFSFSSPSSSLSSYISTSLLSPPPSLSSSRSSSLPSILPSPSSTFLNATIPTTITTTSSSMELNNNNNNNNNNIDSSPTSSLLPPLTSSTTSSSSSSTISTSNTTITCTSNMICSFCFTEKKNMPVCAQCKIQIYCSTKCLKQDRQRHFILCQKYQDY